MINPPTLSWYNYSIRGEGVLVRRRDGCGRCFDATRSDNKFSIGQRPLVYSRLPDGFLVFLKTLAWNKTQYEGSYKVVLKPSGKNQVGVVGEQEYPEEGGANNN